jgi:glucuronoarabinoxylan endo-1,4-beta-xylanase
MTFNVLIENLAFTYPQIISNQFEAISVQSDTTLNFSVTKIPEAVVNMDSVLQYIRGFGAANIMSWRPDMTDSEIQTAFGTGDGQLGFSMLRLRLPSGTGWDFSVQVATAKKAYDLGVLVFASPWSPPASLKSNNSTTGGYLLESHYQDFVDHLNSFIDYMADNGVSLYAVSVQNEPDIEVSYESCDYTPDQMKNFMANYAGGIKTKVIAPESFQFRKNMSDPILNDSAACANLDIVGGHIYGGGLESYPLAEEKGKEIWMTEHLTNDDIFPMPWSEALAVGTEINDCMTAGMSAYIWWYIVRFYGPISDGDHNGAKGSVTKKGYVMSQFSRFIRPGYHRVFCNKTPQRGVAVSSYKNDDGKLVIVAINQASSALKQVFKIEHGNPDVFIPYTTAETKNCVRADSIAMINGSFTVTLEASSITTFISD